MPMPCLLALQNGHSGRHFRRSKVPSHEDYFVSLFQQACYSILGWGNRMVGNPSVSGSEALNDEKYPLQWWIFHCRVSVLLGNPVSRPGIILNPTTMRCLTHRCQMCKKALPRVRFKRRRVRVILPWMPAMRLCQGSHSDVLIACWSASSMALKRLLLYIYAIIT